MTILDNAAFSGFLVAFAGASLALHAGCNATLSRYGGRSFSSLVSFAIGLICCLIYFGIDVGVGNTPLPNNYVKTAPPYAWIGGILGAFYVVVNTVSVPKLGTGTVLRYLETSNRMRSVNYQAKILWTFLFLYSTFVCGEIIMACIVDHFALVGVAQRSFTVWRILASLGLVGSVVVIANF